MDRGEPAHDRQAGVAAEPLGELAHQGGTILGPRRYLQLGKPASEALGKSRRIPQSPGEDHLAQVLCDADLDYLGRTDFFAIGDRLFAEFKRYGVLSTERAWNELQVEFLNKHRYFTATNVRDREPMKQKNLRAVERWLEEHPAP